MTKILVLYHSFYGHVETMAQAEAEGAREVPGTTVTLKRVPETMSAEAVKQAGGKLDQSAPVAAPTSWRTTTASSSARPRASAT